MNNTHKNKKNHITYDLVIIGGGLAGLYTLYKLSKKYNHLKILLLESGQRYGGRIYSYKETIDGQDFVMDLGAGRLGHHQPLINDLINELGLKPKIVDIPNTKTYIEVAENGKVHNKTHFKDYIMGKLTKFFFSPLITKLGKSILQKYYLCELIKKYVSVSFSQKVASVFEYSSDLNEFNAYDAIEYFKHDYNSETKFFTLNGGLEQIIEHLIIAIKKTRSYKLKNIKLLNLSNVENITNKNTNNKNTNNNLFKIEVNNYRTAKIYNIYSKYAVCAVPKKTLEKLELFKPILRDLNSINSINLLRIYEIYNKTNGETWFKNVEKTITNSQVQFVIPINPNNGLIMSSYSDCANANYWNLLLAKKGLEFVKAKLNIKLNQIFSIYNISIPQSKYIKMYFWDAGVACWKKNVDSDYISSKLLNPYSNVFIIGENYSKYQAWCEGALMTSENCITKLVTLLMTNNTATRKKGGKKMKQIKIKQYNNLTPEEVKKHNKKEDAWTIIENKVYNITSWIPKHPGGEIIMQALGKDATQLFIANNHPSYVKKTILPKYYIGTLKN